MRVAVIGAGVAGLVAAYELGRAGHACDVYERWPGLGGQVATMELEGASDRLEHYYHHLFTTDREIVGLYEELGMGENIEWLPSSVAVFAEGRSWPFTGPLDLLRFKPLSPWGRVRMGAGALALQRLAHDAGRFERATARRLVERWMGRAAWRRLWGPLLEHKFSGHAEEISAAWLWSKLTLRRRIEGESARQELLGYPRGGWQPLLEELRRRIEAGEGRVLIDRPARSIERTGGGFVVEAGAAQSFRAGLDPRDFPADGREAYEAVLATVPSDVFTKLLAPAVRGEIGAGYLAKVEDAEYHAALCLLLVLDRSFTPFYWTNVADPALPFIGLIEHTNLIPAERYGGRQLLYVANYVERDDPLLELDGEGLLGHYEPGLRRVNPGFARSWVADWRLHREPAAQPIVRPGYRERMPQLRTPAPGLVLANTTQIYPEDRGTNYSVRLGRQAAAALLGG